MISPEVYLKYGPRAVRNKLLYLYSERRICRSKLDALREELRSFKAKGLIDIKEIIIYDFIREREIIIYDPSKEREIREVISQIKKYTRLLNEINEDIYEASEAPPLLILYSSWVY